MSHAENGIGAENVSRGSSFARAEAMRKTMFVLAILAALGCMKKQADGTYHVDKKQVNNQTEKLKAGAKQVEKKVGQGLEKAGEKLKHDASKH